MKIEIGLNGFLGILGIVFIVLKLCGVISWEWWIVLLPFIIHIALWLIMLLIYGIATAVATFMDWRRNNGR